MLTPPPLDLNVFDESPPAATRNPWSMINRTRLDDIFRDYGQTYVLLPSVHRLTEFMVNLLISRGSPWKPDIRVLRIFCDRLRSAVLDHLELHRHPPRAVPTLRRVARHVFRKTVPTNARAKKLLLDVFQFLVETRAVVR